MLKLINDPGLKDSSSGKIVASYAHPFFWAPFIIVGEGSGITPSGLVIELRDHQLRAPVNDAALRQALNNGSYGYLNTGLYMVLLSWHEETSDAIAEVGAGSIRDMGAVMNALRPQVQGRADMKAVSTAVREMLSH